MDLDPIILSDLRTGGPWVPTELVVDLNNRGRLGLLDGFDGTLGESDVAESLARLRAAGRAVEEGGEWSWLPEMRVGPTGRTKQTALF